MTIGTRETFERALKRARAHGGGAAAIDLGDNRYQVASSQGGTVYAIFVNSRGDFWCSCPAGVAETACWHTAAVYLKRVAEQAGGQRPIPAAAQAGAEMQAEARESDADTRQRIKAQLAASIACWSEVDDDPEAFASIYGRKIA